MFLVYNSDVLAETNFGVSANDRAFQYGDGLFETIRYERNTIWFWPDHYARLTAGARALHLRLPDNTTEASLYELLIKLIEVNRLRDQTARIKLQVWRQPGGLYTPDTNLANLLITARPGKPFSITDRLNVRVNESIRLSHSPYSAFKTLASLPYVLAGLIKQEQGLDDIILLSTHPGNYLAECQAANLFWFSEGILYTPSLESGCVGGILRQHILRRAEAIGQAVDVGLHPYPVLSSAEAIFCGNVNGIQWVRFIDGVGRYPAGHERATDLFRGLL
ncbi:aminotransferase class IV [Spirosoma rigui]|uniref:aminotransferase class IV n=1 Tax=Spirosoma rigui TaxID=564064 RepID=UPI0009B00C99|nr:aminotransferase class IV [Spirosoma rigui]